MNLEGDQMKKERDIDHEWVSALLVSVAETSTGHTQTGFRNGRTLESEILY